MKTQFELWKADAAQYYNKQKIGEHWYYREVSHTPTSVTFAGAFFYEYEKWPQIRCTDVTIDIFWTRKDVDYLLWYIQNGEKHQRLIEVKTCSWAHITQDIAIELYSFVPRDGIYEEWNGWYYKTQCEWQYYYICDSRYPTGPSDGDQVLIVKMDRLRAFVDPAINRGTYRFDSGGLDKNTGKENFLFYVPIDEIPRNVEGSKLIKAKDYQGMATFPVEGVVQ